MCFEALIGKIKSVERIEKYIAIKDDKLSIHQKKWENKPYIRQREQGIDEFVQRYIYDM